MATRIEPFSVTTPAGVGVSAFQRTPLPFNDGIVQRVDIRIPPGPSGLVGFRLAHGDQSVIPYSGSEWIIADNESLSWPLENFPSNSGWELWTYNNDVYQHTIYVRFLVTDDAGFTPVVVTPLALTPTVPAEFEPVLDLDLESL